MIVARYLPGATPVKRKRPSWLVRAVRGGEVIWSFISSSTCRSAIM